MSQATARFAPAEITLEFAGASYLFRLPLPLIAELQEARAVAVTWPDGATGRKPKPLGAIWREHAENGEYDPLDSAAIVRLGLIGGGLPRADADRLMREYVDPPIPLPPMPREELWRFALAVLMGTCQGFTPPGSEKPPGEDDDLGNLSPAGELTSPSTTPAPSETA